jgi:hypothetical protein
MKERKRGEGVRDWMILSSSMVSAAVGGDCCGYGAIKIHKTKRERKKR